MFSFLQDNECNTSHHSLFILGTNAFAGRFCTDSKKCIKSITGTQTGPAAYNIQTNDNVWRRLLDQLLATSPASSDLYPERSPDVLGPAPVSRTHRCSGPLFHTPAVTVNETEAPVVAPDPKDTVPPMNKETDVPAGRRYPAREQQPPARMGL